MAGAKRRGSPAGRGRLQAWGRGEVGTSPRLDGRALAAALDDLLRGFGDTGGRLLCLVWTYEPPDPALDDRAMALLLRELEDGEAVAAAGRRGEAAAAIMDAPIVFALASVLAAQSELVARELPPQGPAN